MRDGVAVSRFWVNNRYQPKADSQSVGLGGWMFAHKKISAVGASIDEFSFVDYGLSCVRCELKTKLLGSGSENTSDN